MDRGAWCVAVCGFTKKVGQDLLTKQQQATLLLPKEESVGSDCSSLKSQ